MVKIKLENGDYLEKTYASIIREKLPCYEYLWSSYIGHNGHGKMPEINIPEIESYKRQQVGEKLYTCLESLICIHEIASETLTVDLKKGRSYINMLNSFIAFQAHAGRIRDGFIKLGELLLNDTEGQLVQKLEEVYQTRNVVLHGKKIPMRIEDGLVMLPKIQGKEIIPNTWHEGLTWDEKDLLLGFLSDYLDETRNQIFEASNSIIAQLTEPVKAIVSQYNISIHAPIDTTICPSGVAYVETPISASTFTYNYKV